MQSKTALVVGATGLVGSALVQQLLADDRFGSVQIFVRRSSGMQHPKLVEHRIDFARPESWQHLVRGDVLFSTLGTTLRQAGSKEAQYTIDFTYQYHFAQAAARNGVPVYLLVSSAMANARSRIFYTRMKGELEDAVRALPFRTIHLLQPGMLDGQRKEKRWGERIGLALLKALNRLGIARRQRPVPAATVARAMVRLSFQNNKAVEVHTLLDVFAAAGDSTA